MSDQNQNPPPQYYPPPYHHDDEITLKELILKLIEFWKKLKKSILWIIIAVIIGGGVFYLKASFKETKYKGTLSFMISEEAENKQVALSSDILGLGVIDYNLDKITALVKSSRIMYRALTRKITVNGVPDYMGNHIIDIYNLHDKWNKESINSLNKEQMLSNFEFVEDSWPDFNQHEIRALTNLQDVVIGNGLKGISGFLSVSYDQTTEVFTLQASSPNPNLTIESLNTVYEELSAFYIERTVGRPLEAFREAEKLVDTLQQQLSSAEWALVRAEDRTQGLIGRSAQLNIADLSCDVKDIDRRYQQALTTKEALESIINRQTPDFLLLDQTYIPLVVKSSKVKQFVTGGFLLGFLATIFIIGRKIVRDAMA